ncbi:MAG TPA: GlsB/YeaQ/YmgE family stress response membrane protein [Polyangiaceae bacterium]|nr:GlsB/YeaQ/YmgE family stress response membrane protein [Polyangiaceae bacterium]
MGILMFIVFGLVVGLLARALMPGRQSMGLGKTALLGIVGSFIGGFVGALLTDSRVGDFNTAGLIGSIVGAMVLLLAVGGLASRRGLTV